MSLTVGVDANPQHNLHFVAKVELKVLIEANRSIKRRIGKECKAFFMLICSKTKIPAAKKKSYFRRKPLHKLSMHYAHCNCCTRDIAKKAKILCSTSEFPNHLVYGRILCST